jgi:hypothetical protein
MITMRPVEAADGTRMIKLGEGLVFPVDALSSAPNDLRRRWDVCCSHIERGDDVSGALKVLTRETTEHLWSAIMMRVAHLGPQSVLDIGIIGGHGEATTDLSELAAQYASREKRKEGIKPDAAEGTRDRKTQRAV